jgi:hypothetical protein
LDGLTILVTERIESLKAGIIGGTTLLVGMLVESLGHNWLVGFNFGCKACGGHQLFSLQTNLGWDLCFKLGSAGISGFLFAVTYRYIIRADDNSHLKDGAVLAFAIIRSLALWEGNPNPQENGWALIISSGESILGFILVRLFLDLSLNLGWLHRS